LLSIAQTLLKLLAYVVSCRVLGESLLARYHQMNMPDTKVSEFTLRIDGMHCGSCARRVGQALATVPGVRVSQVLVGEARLAYSADPAAVENAIAALAKAGFTAHLES
jgi:copper chaperone CopZ